MTHYLVKKIRKLAEQRPEHKVGTACLYTLNGAPCCIVGTALVELGKLDPANPHDKEGEHVEGVGAFSVLPALGLKLSTDERRWISRVQREQDQNLAWAEAVRRADEEYQS